MKDKLDYYAHKSYTTPYYHRQYEQDVLPKEDDSKENSIIKRAALIAIPFFSLYTPAGRVISLGMGSVRALTNGAGIFTADSLGKSAFHVSQVALASLALAATLYQFTLGLYITTGVDLMTNLFHICEMIASGQYHAAFEELLQEPPLIKQ